MPFRLHLKSRTVEIEAAKKLVVALPVVLIPQNAPLGEEVRAVRVSRVVRHGPGEQLAVGIELHWASGD